MPSYIPKITGLKIYMYSLGIILCSLRRIRAFRDHVRSTHTFKSQVPVSNLDGFAGPVYLFLYQTSLSIDEEQISQ